MRSARAVALALGLATADSHAQGVPPWVPSGRVPLADDALSAEALRRDEPLFIEPNPAAPRRGAAALGARLPVFGAEGAPGCRGDWLLVGPTAWVCSDHVKVSAALPARETPPVSADGLPFPYYFVGSEGVFGYSDLASVDTAKPAAELQPGFAIALVARARGPGGGAELGMTTKGLWLPLRDLRPVRALDFRGYDVGGSGFDRGFVVVDRPVLRDAPGGKKLEEPGPVQFAVVPIRSRENDARGRPWVQIGSGTWLEDTAVRIPAPGEVPPEARAGERWIDVDRQTQILTAYEGRRAVFATLVSTGTGKDDAPTVTPPGVHRIWVKLRTTDMTNLEEEEARRYYAIEDVPWVLFFKKGYGLHGAFWHRSFGNVRSHGCVNLTPADARRVFDWAGPRLPSGWTAALPTDYDPGTLVRVR